MVEPIQPVVSDVLLELEQLRTENEDLKAKIIAMDKVIEILTNKVENYNKTPEQFVKQIDNLKEELKLEKIRHEDVPW